MYRQTDHPDDQIAYKGQPEYPVATLESGVNRVQIIPEFGAWIPVLKVGTGYRAMSLEEIVSEIQGSINWAYEFTLGIGGVPADVIGEEREPNA